ncbi:MAG: MFS transporter, partial [Sandarakinorhabdus sp.]|nr:MFS transporter [Sandarakinorhabdus sp.]
RGLSASQSGFAMLPLLFGILIGSVIAGQLARRTLQYKPALVAGGAIVLMAVFALTLETQATPRWMLSANLLALGIGLGPAQGMFTLAIQSAVGHARVGVTTASAQFCRQIGATVGVALFGALLTFNLSRELPIHVPQIVAVGQPIDLSEAQALAMDRTKLETALAARHSDDPAVVAAAEAGLKTGFANSIWALFPVALFVLGLAWLVTLSVPALKLRGREPPPQRDAEAAAVAVL